MSDTIDIKIAFTGGLELLFQNRKSMTYSCAPDTQLGALIAWMSTQCAPEKRSVFIQNESVRPGILVLINDADWELEGEDQYVLQDKDEILFVSTLHGG